MLTFPNHQRNANKTHNEITFSHLLGCYCPKKNYKITNIENDVKKLKPFCTVGGSVKWYSHLENNMEVS